MKSIKNEARMSNDARLAVLETTILNINSSLVDIKRSFEKIDVKFESLENKMDSKFESLENKMDSKIESLENKMDSKFESLENKMDSKFESLENKMDSKFESIESRIWSNFLWLMGMIIGLAGLIAHTQHWI